MTRFINKHRVNERGVTSIEYGLLAALIAITAIIAFSALGNANEAKWLDWVGKVMTAIAGD